MLFTVIALLFILASDPRMKQVSRVTTAHKVLIISLFSILAMVPLFKLKDVKDEDKG